MTRDPDHTGPIAYLTGEYPKVSHTFIQREVNALRKLGLDVRTFSVRRPRNTEIMADQKDEEAATYYVLEAARQPAKLLAAHIDAMRRDLGIWFSTLGLAWRMRSPGWKAALYQLFYFAEAGVLAQELRRQGVVHLHNHFGNSSCSVAILASALSGIPYSFTEHGPAIFFEPERWGLGEKIARARFVVAISDFCRSQLMLFSDPRHWDKIGIVHCGIHPERYLPAADRKPGKTVLYVGRLEPVKGLPVLLDALARIAGRQPDARLSVIGDGTARAGIERQVAELGLSDRVDFLGYRTQAEVAEALSQADMLVLPSFAEGVPVVLMEAMASGIPVIATRVAGVQELVVDGVAGFTVPPGNVEVLAQKMEVLLESSGRRQDMGRAGRAIVEAEFDVAKEAAWLASFLPDGPKGLRPSK